MGTINRHMDWSDTWGPYVGSGRGGSVGQLAYHLQLATARASKTIRLNSRTLTDAVLGIEGDNIGFQSKPGQGVATAKNVIGAEISPRVNNAIALTGGGSITGLHVDTYLKGTTGDIGGSVRALEVEMVTDDAGARTITGNVSHLRLRTAWSGTISGYFSAFRVEKPEAQTGSQDFDGLFQLTSTSAAWNSAGTPSTQAGFIKIEVNGVAKYIQLFSDP